MKTNLLKKALALVLSIMVVLTAFGGALSVFAEDVTEPEVVVDPYGTEEDGIDTNGNDVFDTIDPVIGVKNLNFEEGLKYWSSKEDKNGAASYALKKYTIDGVTAYGFKTEWLGSQWDGVATVRMQLNGVKAGDTIQIALEYMIDERFTTPLNKFTYEKDGETVNAAKNGHGLALYQFQEGSATTTTTKVEWGNQCVNNTAVHGTWITEGCCATVAAYDNPIVAIRIQDTRTEAVKEAHATILTNEDGSVDSPIYIKSIKLLKLNADGSFTNLQDGEPVTKYGTPLYGTEEDGITGVWMKEQYKHYGTTGDQWGTNALYPVVEGFKNGDFSEGFKYWGYRYADTAKAALKLSDVFKITAEGTLKYKGLARDNVENTTTTYAGLVKSRFTLPGIKKGDTIKLFMDAKNSGTEKSAFAITLMEINGNAASTNLDNTYTNAEGESVAYDKAAISVSLNAGTDWGLKTSDNLVVTNDNPIFRITSQVNTQAGGIEIDNLRIVKLNADGVTYTDIVTGELVYGNGVAVGGSYEDGWSTIGTNAIPTYTGPFAGVQNGDFTEGLKFWGSRAATGAGSDYAEVKTDGDNTYVHLKGKKDANYCGIRSTLFHLPETKAGDQLVLMYKYKNGDATKFQAFFGPQNSTGDDWVLASNSASVVKQAATDTEWGYAVSAKILTVGSAISTADATWMLQHPFVGTDYNKYASYRIEISNSTANEVIDIDDMQIVKYIDAYTYKTFDGETIEFDPAWAGTFADGVTTSTGEHSEMNNNYNNEYGVVNGDFEKGLMYWGCSGAIGSTAYGSTHVDLVTEDGNSYFKFDGTTQTYYRGMKSGAVFIPKAKLAVGDSVVIKFDAYDPNGDAKNVQLKFEPRWGNGSSSNSSVNQCTQIADKGNGWKTYITQVKSPITAASEVTTQAPAAGDWAFHVSIQVASNAASTAGFDNIELVKVIDKFTVQTLDDDTVITWDPAWAGTFEDGVTTSTGETSQMNNFLNKDYYVVNGDFSKGLKFWGADGYLGSTCYGSTYVDLITEGDNNYVKFDGETRTYFNGFKSGKISVPAADLAINDQVALVFDVYDPENSGNFQMRLDAASGSGVTVVTAINYATLIADKGNGWKTYVGKFGTITAASNSTDSNAIAAGDWTFRVAAQVIGGKASTAAIDNIKIVKYATAYSVIDLATDETIEWLPAWVGTFENGAENLNANSANNEYGVINGDFSEGLKYWGCSGGSISPNYGSTYTSVVTEDGNSYIKFDGVARTYFAGFKSGIISIPASELQVGDYIAVKYNIYDPDNNAKNIQVKIESRCGDGSNSNSMVSASTLIEDKGNGWKTYATKFQKAIANVSASTNGIKAGDWTYTITASVQGSAIQYEVDEEGKFVLDENGKKIPVLDENGNTIIVEETKCVSTAAIDNISIVRADRGGFGTKAVIVDLEGNAVQNVTAGDANLDGKVDLVDLVRAKKYAAAAAGDGITSPISFVCTDIDGSDAIDAADFIAMINKILGA